MRTAIAMIFLVACGGGDVSRTLGARCERSADCEDRCLTPSNDFPGGFCTLSCVASDECPSDAECIDKEGGVCLFTCRDNIDCEFLGPNWICRDENTRADQNRQVKVCRGD